ncbi:MAG: 6-phosphogluconolactonase [Enterobacterales bacterium]|nr:6-phosphogluconolactonase [Enterobacterales bacterium]
MTARCIEMKFDNVERLNQSLLATISNQLKQDIQQNKQACLLVSGGSTPKRLYQSLSQYSLHWNNVSIAMVDERWVDIDHPKSNQAFIEQTLVNDKAAEAHFYPMIDASKSVKQQNIQDAVSKINQAYSRLPKNPICILGMGSDGHTASFFPHAKGLDHALNSKNTYCCAIQASQSETTGEQTQRLTITLDYLQSCQAVYLLITGQQKWEVYQKALACTEVSTMPVSAVLNQKKTPVFVYWCP